MPRGDIKSTHVDVSVALPPYLDSNLRDLMIQTGNVRKRPFETGRTTALGSRSIDVIYRTRPRADRPYHAIITQYLGAKINIIFELPKIFSKKYRFWPKILDSVGKKRGKSGITETTGTTENLKNSFTVNLLYPMAQNTGFSGFCK